MSQYIFYKTYLIAAICSRTNLLRTANIVRKADLTTQSKKLYTAMKGLLHTARKLDAKNASNKARLEDAQIHITSKNFINKRVNPVAPRFILTQLRMQCKRERGGRYSVNDKILAVFLLKQSPR